MKNNIGLKLIAFLLAILTYIAIHEATNFEIPYDIPVEIEKAEGVAILEQDPMTVQVTFRGSQVDLRQIKQSDIKAVIKCVSTQITGSESAVIRVADIRGVIPSVKIVQIRPPTVKMKFDREDTKMVNVSQPKTVGNPLIGQASIDYNPKTVMIKGPSTRLKTQQEVDAEPIDVDGRVESFIKQVRILTPAGSWVTKIDPAEITAKVNITRESIAREVKAVPISVVSAPGSTTLYTINPATADITISGSAEAVNKFMATPIVAFIEVSSLDTDSIKPQTAPVNVFAKAEAGINITVNPRQVEVTIREKVN